MIGKSILDCHNPVSINKIMQAYKKLQNGEGEVRLNLDKDQEKAKTVFVGVRDDNGRLLGYYERSGGVLGI